MEKNRIIDFKLIDIDRVISNPENWRKHPFKQQEIISKSIDEIGIVMPILINWRVGDSWGDKSDTEIMLDGHLRIPIYYKHGIKKVPAVFVQLDPEEERYILLSLDQITGLAETNYSAVNDLILKLKGSERFSGMLDELKETFDDKIRLLVDSKKEQEEAIPDAEPKIDIAEELAFKWGVREGQLWKLGEHYILCSDCSYFDNVSFLFGDHKANLLFTSPPYWVGMDYETQKSENEIDQFIKNCVASWYRFIKKDNGRIVINTGTAAIHRIEKSRKVEVLPLIFKWQTELRAYGWIARHYRVWAKSGGFAGGRVSPKTDAIDQRWENIVNFEHMEGQYLGTFWNPEGNQRGQERTGAGWAQQGTWTDIKGVKSSNGHVAAFPLEIPERNLLLYSKRNEIVFEPFLGSGTTLIACERLKRKCFAMEYLPGYVGVSLERWHEVTGQKPELIKE